MTSLFQSDALSLFTELAAIPSPSGTERAVADRVYEELRALGLEPEVDDSGASVGSDCGNLYARIEPTKAGTPSSPGVALVSGWAGVPVLSGADAQGAGTAPGAGARSPAHVLSTARVRHRDRRQGAFGRWSRSRSTCRRGRGFAAQLVDELAEDSDDNIEDIAARGHEDEHD